MKKLINTIEVHELRAKRALFIKKARELEKQAAKFRQDAMEAGCKLHQLGEPMYTRHPIYADMVYPYLRMARNISLNARFDLLFQVRTPMSTEPDWTEGIAGIMDEPTETMGKCIDLINSRPTFVVDPGKIVSQPATTAEPEEASDNSSNSK